MSELDTKLEELKKYSSGLTLLRLNKIVYNLNEQQLSSLTDDQLSYVHVKLHNSLSYKKPYAPVEKIKKYHDIVIKLMKSHQIIDKLDE
jgi:hypothetical protein